MNQPIHVIQQTRTAAYDGTKHENVYGPWVDAKHFTILDWKYLGDGYDCDIFLAVDENGALDSALRVDLTSRLILDGYYHDDLIPLGEAMRPRVL